MEKFKNKLYYIYFSQFLAKGILNVLYYSLTGLCLSLMVGFFALSLSNDLTNTEILLVSNSLFMFGFIILLSSFVLAIFRWFANGLLWSNQLLLCLSIFVYLIASSSLLTDIITVPYEILYNKLVYQYLIYLAGFLIIKFGKTYITRYFDNYNKNLVLVEDYKQLIRDFFKSSNYDLLELELENQIIKDDYKGYINISNISSHHTIIKLSKHIGFVKDKNHDTNHNYDLSENNLFGITLKLKQLPFIDTLYI